jgi:hypothetical protein
MTNKPSDKETIGGIEEIIRMHLYFVPQWEISNSKEWNEMVFESNRKRASRATQQINAQAWVDCPECGGSSYEGYEKNVYKEYALKPCPTCTSGKMYLYKVNVCKNCNGRGGYKHPYLPCASCNGTGQTISPLTWKEWYEILELQSFSYKPQTSWFVWRDNILHLRYNGNGCLRDKPLPCL